jgi:hypothetical protein
MTTQEIIQALEEMEAQYGEMTPRLLVDLARDPSNVFHERIFKFTDEEIADQARLDIARRILSVKYTVIIDDHLVRTVSFVRDPKLGTRVQGYVNLSQVDPHSQQAKGVLTRELACIEALIDRVYGIAQRLGLTTEFAAALMRIALKYQPKAKTRKAMAGVSRRGLA